jgi:CotH kinase protein/Right handed beta helix region
MLVTPQKENNTKPTWQTKIGFASESRIVDVFVILVGAVAAFAVLIFVLKDQIRDEIFQWADAKGYGYFQEDSQLRDALVKAPRNYLSAEKLPKLVLDVKFKHMQKIFKKRSEALKKKFLIQGKNDFVPAAIRVEGGQKIKAKIRLKGDYVDHLKGSKWSFRVHTKGKHHFAGLRRFSVQHPKTRGFQQEPLFFDMLKQMDLLAPRYFFVDLTVNGKDIGVMAIEEHFSKEILESNGRKEGVIVRFDESVVFDARDGFERRMGLDGGAFDSYKNTFIDAFRTSKVKKSERLSRDFRYAVGMLRGFVQGKMKASDVFDAEQIGKLAAAADLWGAWHVLVWRNIRFYLNPITMKLEPIAYDANHDDRGAVGTLVSHKSQLFSELLMDPEIFTFYKKTVTDLANQVIRGDLLEILKGKESTLLNQLHNEYFLLPSINFGYFTKQAIFISTYDFSQYKPTSYHFTETIKIDDIRDIDYPKILHAYIINGAEPTVEIAAAVPHEIEVTDIRLKSKNAKHPDIQLQDFADKLPIALDPLDKGKAPVFHSYNLTTLENKKGYDLQVSAKIKGYKKNFRVKVMPYYSVIDRNPVPVSSIEEQLVKHPFLNLSADKKSITITQGKYEIHDSVVIPAGYQFIVEKGAVLQFYEDAILLSYSPVNMIGSVEQPIILEPVATDNKNAVWQGMVVMRAGLKSRLEHVEFRKTKGITQGGWQLTGGVTFYESSVTIKNSSFKDNQGEDALNIVHSNFDITDIQIEKTASDAFDADFSDGTFTDGLFKDIGLLGGGDAIDISGSNVVVKGTRFVEVSDKALSVGEKSTMVVDSVLIKGVGTGAASKDGSSLEISDSEITDVKTAGLMAYIKKPEYGGASIVAKGMKFVEPIIPARVQVGSRVTIDGDQVATQAINVKQMYQTIMKPGLIH